MGPRHPAAFEAPFPKKNIQTWKLLQRQPSESRWNMMRIIEWQTAVLMIIATAHCTMSEKMILAMQQACSAEGFICQGLIKLPSPKLR